MFESKLDRDMKLLSKLGRRVALVVDEDIKDLPPQIRQDARGPIIGSIMEALARAYFEDRESYLRAGDPSPPTQMPKPGL